MKDELRFNFQEYEIDSGFSGKPHAFTRAFWSGEEREFALALVNRYVRFCEVDKLESGEWNFAVSEPIKGRKYATVNPKFVENAFQVALSKQQIGRLFCFESRGGDGEIESQWVFIKPDKHLVLSSNGGHKDFEPLINLPCFESPGADWYAELQKLIEGESDFGFSVRWNGSTGAEKAWTAAHFVNGTRAELENIAHLILRLYGREIAVIQLKNTSKVLEPKSTISTLWNDSTGQESKNYIALWAVFLEHFKPRLNLELCRRYSKAGNKYPLVFREKIGITQHEKLEIQLELRQWLQGKVPEEQINSLLA